MPGKAQSDDVKAAGGVVWRRGSAGLEIAVVHRPRYDDWSLPKGKLDRGETFEQAALREVGEEIGAICTLGTELTAISYRDARGRPKTVRYWLMEAGEVGEPEDPDEIDEVCWLNGPDATARLTYPRDRDVVAEALEHLGA